MNTFASDLPSFESLAAFWTGSIVGTNVLVGFSLIGALLLGLLVGYERSYRGRAAGMRTYGLVCMASAALTVIAGYPQDWYGANAMAGIVIDPTRIIQGIVTGVGFLGAGVIMKEGLNISGLTTAASIWAASVIGVLVGVGFYLAAMLLALMCTVCMVWIPKLAGRLPARQAVAVVLQFRQHVMPSEERLRDAAARRGYEISPGSIAISLKDGRPEWQFVAVAFGRASVAPISQLASELMSFDGIEAFQLSYARN